MQRCITQLGGSPGPAQNAQPLRAGADYSRPARTADEIRATPAAHEGAVSRAPQRFRTMDPVEAVDRRGELADPVQHSEPATDPQRRRIILPNDPWTV